MRSAKKLWASVSDSPYSLSVEYCDVATDQRIPQESGGKWRCVVYSEAYEENTSAYSELVSNSPRLRDVTFVRAVRTLPSVQLPSSCANNITKTSPSAEYVLSSV